MQKKGFLRINGFELINLHNPRKNIGPIKSKWNIHTDTLRTIRYF
jgi:hypothetical protein